MTLMENAFRHGEKITNIRFFCAESEGTQIITAKMMALVFHPERRSIFLIMDM